MTYNRDSIVRALDAHIAKGFIRSWRYVPPAEVKGAQFRVVVEGRAGSVSLRDLREAWIFVQGMAMVAQEFSHVGLTTANDLCGHCGRIATGFAQLPDGTRVCHSDERSCYHQVTVHGRKLGTAMAGAGA